MENTPRNVIVQLGSLIALYLSVTFFLTLVFGMINLIYPDAADTYYEIENATDSVRLGIAMVVVFFPAFIALTRVTTCITKTRKRKFLYARNPLAYLSLTSRCWPRVTRYTRRCTLHILKWRPYNTFCYESSCHRWRSGAFFSLLSARSEGVLART
jgi:hypothetical protein